MLMRYARSTLFCEREGGLSYVSFRNWLLSEGVKHVFIILTDDEVSRVGSNFYKQSSLLLSDVRKKTHNFPVGQFKEYVRNL